MNETHKKITACFTPRKRWTANAGRRMTGSTSKTSEVAFVPPSFPSMISSSRHIAELDELGYTLLSGWVPADLLEELRATVARLYAIEGEKAGSEFRQEPGCLRLANL